MKALRVLLALLAIAAVAVTGLLVPASAHAAEPQSFVSISLTTMTPSLPQRDGQVRLTGQVTNVSEAPLTNLQAILWRYSEPLLTAEDLEQTLTAEADQPIGRRLFERDYQNIPSETNRSLAPGASTTFDLTTDVANLDLPRADGVYLFGVHVRGRTAQEPERDQTLGRARTFLPLVQEPPRGTVPLTSVVLLSSRPSQLGRGLLVDEHLAEEVRLGGRLDAMLTAAGAAGTSFAVDPDLIETLTTMREGYQVRAKDGSPTAGRGQADAARWLDRFDQVQTSGDGYRLLYGSPDVAALVHSRQQGLLEDAEAAGRRVPETSSLPLLVLPAGGWADEATMLAIEELRPTAVLLSDVSAGGDAPLLRGLGDSPVVRYSAASGGGGPGPDPRDTPVQVRQRALADSWLHAATAAPGSHSGRVRLVTSANQLQGTDAGVPAPWVTQSPLSQLLAGQPAAWDQSYAYPQAAQASEPTAAQLAELRRFARDHTARAELLGNSESAQSSAAAAVARATSSAWRGQNRLRRAYLDPQQEGLDRVLDEALVISTNPKVSTIAREGVEFPITVLNQLPTDPDDPDVNAVRLRLVFVSENPRRLTIKTITTEQIRAGDAYPGRAQVSARANGTVRVRAQLQTLDGTPVGRPRTIDVRVTQNGTTGWAIAAAALVVFVGGTGLRIRRVGRARAAAAAASAAEARPSAQPPSALTSAPPTSTPSPDDPDRLDG